MAARINPSRGGKPDKLFRDALMIAVNRSVEDSDGKSVRAINAIASKVVKKAAEGSHDAAQLIRDTLDGRPATAVAITGEDGGPVQITWKSKA